MSSHGVLYAHQTVPHSVSPAGLPAPLLVFMGGLISVLAFSARTSYQDLDQNIPVITWSTLLVEAVGLGLVAWAVARGGFSWLAIAGAAGLVLAAIVAQFTSAIAPAILEMLAYTALAVAVGRARPMPTIIAVLAVATLHASEHIILPYEEERRVVHGPGMALLPVAWLALAYASQ